MFGPVTPNPVNVGQGQNAYQQQTQANQSPAQAERRDPREDEIQRRDAPAAQSQESTAQSLRSAENNNSAESRDITTASLSNANSNDDTPPTGQERGEILDVFV